MLYIIGIGLSDENDITLKGLDAIRECEFVYLDTYTSRIRCPIENLENLYGKSVVPAKRKLVESGDEIIKRAKNANAAFLVAGDALSATTHIDLMLRAKKEGVKIQLIHNASILSAVASTGLSLYKFGKTASIPFFEKSFEPDSFYCTLKENQSIGAHTLLLLDLKPELDKFMTIQEAIHVLLNIESKRKEEVFSEKTFCIGCARLGFPDQAIHSGIAAELLKMDFGAPPHCLIIPSNLHFIEEEAIRIFV